jgi:pre-mRNA cleavage complex 2 protein Pcf11
MPKLRNAMQCILDDLQSDVQDELEKVSLERLANIDPDLILKIKRTAEDSFRNGGTADSGDKSTQKNEIDTLSFLVETRTPETIKRSKAWEKLKFDHLKETPDMIAALQHLVRDGSTSETGYTRKEAIEMTGALAAAATAASILTNALQQIQNEEKKSKSKSSSAMSGGGGLTGRSGAPARGFFSVDKSLFTNDGIKKKNDAVIGILYNIGLPFVSSSDGRRFATQLELSKHLDALFKKGYVLCREACIEQTFRLF